MRITLESDYALRIVSELAKTDTVVDANTLSSLTSVTPRFTLKILSKLVGGGIVSSFKGTKGGYKLKETPDKITLKRVIELIDGEIAISKCLAHEHICSKQGENKSACKIHRIFDAINQDLTERLGNITIASVI